MLSSFLFDMKSNQNINVDLILYRNQTINLTILRVLLHMMVYFYKGCQISRLISHPTTVGPTDLSMSLNIDLRGISVIAKSSGYFAKTYCLFIRYEKEEANEAPNCRRKCGRHYRR